MSYHFREFTLLALCVALAVPAAGCGDPDPNEGDAGRVRDSGGGSVDSSLRDGGRVVDSGPMVMADAGLIDDGGGMDGGGMDGGGVDGGGMDADGGSADAGPMDGGPTDGGAGDAGTPDGGRSSIPSGFWGLDYGAPNLYRLDPATGAVLQTVALVDAAGTVTLDGGTAMCWDSASDTLYVVVVPDTMRSIRHFGTVNVATGDVTIIASLTARIAGLACAPGGVVYGVSGQGGPTPTSLFTIAPATGLMTLVATLADEPVANPDGEAITWHAGTSLLYRISGNGDPKYFGSITSAGVETSIGATPTPGGEGTALCPAPGGVMYEVNRDDEIGTLSTAGAWTLLSSTSATLTNYLAGCAYIP